MKNEVDHTEMDILLAAYFAGEADATERVQVETWKNASEENRKYFEASDKTWNAAGEVVGSKKFDTDAAWKKVKNRIDQTPDHSGTTKRKYVWMAAAGVALLIGIVSLTWLNRDIGGEVWQVTVESGTTIKRDTLPDNSIAVLNKNSTIHYPSVFEGEVRAVELSGEAFFDVAHDAEHPFLIHTELMDIKVLGTSFNVRAYPGGDSVHVSVSTGRVQCVSNGDTVVITEGEYAVYNKGVAVLRKGNEDDPNRSAYHDRIFRFNNTSLALAVQQLNEAYGCTIILKSDELKACKFSSTKVFYNEPVENIIDAIMVVFPGITSKNEGNTIILQGTGCK